MGQINTSPSEALETPSFDVTGYTAVPNGSNTYNISYALTDVAADHLPTASFGTTAGVFSNNNTLVTFSNVTVLANTNYDVTVENGECINTQVFDGNVLGIMDVVDIANELQLKSNPLQNKILELSYPASVSHLDIAIYSLE